MAKKARKRRRAQPPMLEFGYAPPPRGTYNFQSMEIGHSFPIKTREEMIRVRGAAYQWARRKNKAHEDDPRFVPIEFRCAETDDGTGWRLFRVT